MSKALREDLLLAQHWVMTLRARILAQGNEIVSGRTVDTNSAFLASLLVEHGVEIVGLAAAPDRVEELAGLLTWASRDVDLLLSTGGLGPTSDDCTAQAVGRVLGQPCVESDRALSQIQAWFQTRGRSMPASNCKQALLPKGAEILANPVGTAPGFALTLGRAHCIFFPGVPREMEEMSSLHLVPWLETRCGVRPLRKRFHACGVAESALQDRIARLDLAGVEVAYKTHSPYNTVILGSLDAEALAAASETLRAALGLDLFGEDEIQLGEAFGGLMVDRGWTVATAESCTGGGVARLLTASPGASRWYKGGVVAYSNELKVGELGVSAELLQEHGAVSEACALAMARGARERLDADLALSVTGIAGPGGGTPEKPVGTVWLGLASPLGEAARRLSLGRRDRQGVRLMSEATLVEWARRRVLRESRA